MKFNILIIDDEDAIRLIYQKIIRAISPKYFNVVGTSNAREATNHLIRQKVDLVILDLKMPHVDGRYMFDVIKEYDPDLKVIVASVFPVERQQKLVPEATAYYDKSQGAFQLLELISQTLFGEKETKPLGKTTV